MTKRLVFTAPRGGHVWRTSLNDDAWKPALAAAGVIPVPEPGEPYSESRENGMHALRHFYASVLLDAGENVKALAEYLGHSDPGLTLRVYAHLMPSSRERTRKAVASVFAGRGRTGEMTDGLLPQDKPINERRKSSRTVSSK
nr:integrase family protein [Streptomyces tsukubensis NRRL18488]